MCIFRIFHCRQRAGAAQLAWAAGGRSAGAGGIEPASGALRRSQALRLKLDTILWVAPTLREAPCGGCTGRRWRARERARREATASRAQPVQRGRGGGGKLTEAAGRPAFRDVGRTVAQSLKKNPVVCRGLAQKLTAEGAALCATPGDADPRGRRHNVNYTLRTARRCR